MAFLEIDFMPIRIALVDDNQPFRQAMHEKLMQYPEFAVIWEASSGTEALNSVGQSQPDVLLLDISLADMSGIDVMKLLNASTPSIKVIALSTYGEKHFVLEMLNAGASGYLCKIDARDVAAAINAVSQGNIYLSSELGLILGE